MIKINLAQEEFEKLEAAISPNMRFFDVALWESGKDNIVLPLQFGSDKIVFVNSTINEME